METALPQINRLNGKILWFTASLTTFLNNPNANHLELFLDVHENLCNTMAQLIEISIPFAIAVTKMGKSTKLLDFQKALSKTSLF